MCIMFKIQQQLMGDKSDKEVDQLFSPSLEGMDDESMV